MKFQQPGYWKTILVTLLILIACLLPSNELKNIKILNFQYEDLLIHFIMFFTFSFILYSDLNKRKRSGSKNNYNSLIVITAGIVLGFLSELFQYLIISLHRSASLFDFLFDIIGTICGIFLIKLIHIAKK